MHILSDSGRVVSIRNYGDLIFHGWIFSDHYNDRNPFTVENLLELIKRQYPDRAPEDFVLSLKTENGEPRLIVECCDVRRPDTSD